MALIALLARQPPRLLVEGDLKRGERVLLTETLLPRIARKGAACQISIGGQARKARIERFELDEGFQPHHPPFRKIQIATFLGAKDSTPEINTSEIIVDFQWQFPT